MLFPVHLQSIFIAEEKVDIFIPDAEAVKQAYQNGEIDFPYWSQVWPSAIALSQFILQQPQFVQHKNVLELGAGLGLPSLVAAQYAASVLCTDLIPEALEIAQGSSDFHQLTNLQTMVIDWRYFPENIQADVLLLSDINYEPDAFDLLMKMIHQFLQNGTTILLSTPQRLMAKEFIAALLQHCILQKEILVENYGDNIPIAVLVISLKYK